MPVNVAEQTHLSRPVAVARPAFILLALASLADSHAPGGAAEWFLFGYFLVAVLFLAIDSLRPQSKLRLPVWADVVGLAVLLALSSSFVPILFIFGFVAFAIASYASPRTARL